VSGIAWHQGEQLFLNDLRGIKERARFVNVSLCQDFRELTPKRALLGLVEDLPGRSVQRDNWINSSRQKALWQHREELLGSSVLRIIKSSVRYSGRSEIFQKEKVYLFQG